MNNIVYYISADNDYYINKQGDYYIFSSSNSRHGYHTYIRINGQWKKVKPTIINSDDYIVREAIKYSAEILKLRQF